MKKDQNLPNKNIHSNNRSGKTHPNNSNYSIQQSPYNKSYRGRSPYQKTHKISHKTDIVDHIVELVNLKITNQDQIQTNPNFCLMPDPIKIQEIEIIQIIDLETPHTIDKEIILTIGIETIQTIEIPDIKITDRAIILTTDQNIIMIKIYHAIIHRKEAQAMTTDKGTTLNHHIGITHLNIKIKYNQLKKLNQTPRY